MTLPASHRSALSRMGRDHVRQAKALGELRSAVVAEISRREKDSWSDPNPKKGTVEGLAIQRDFYDRAITTHKVLSTLADDPRILRALGDIRESPGLLDLATADLTAFLAKYDVIVPRTLRVQRLFSDTGKKDLGHAPRALRITFGDQDAPFELDWSSQGFGGSNQRR
jgi:hypothetical protein